MEFNNEQIQNVKELNLEGFLNSHYNVLQQKLVVFVLLKDPGNPFYIQTHVGYKP